MGICYELYNHTQKEFTNLKDYAVETKFWVNSPLANLFQSATRYYWFHTDNVELISDSENRYFDLRNTYKDVTNEIVKEYNQHAEDNETRYHDGTMPKVLTIDEYQNTNKELGESTCPKCGYDGLGVFDDRAGFQQHAHQLNPNNPFLWICGNCSEAFQRKTKEDEGKTV